MPYRKVTFINGGIYHVFNRGVDQKPIFLEKGDYKRFINLLDYYKYTREVKYSIAITNPHQVWDSQGDPLVDLICYCLMPNHFHLLLRQTTESGVSNFLRLIQNSFTKYFNTKHQRTGHLLQGLFKAVQINTDEQLLHVSRYIHLNPFVAGLINDLKGYQWSSYRDYFEEKNQDIDSTSILSFFKTPPEYERFVVDHADYAKSLEKIKQEGIDF